MKYSGVMIATQIQWKQAWREESKENSVLAKNLDQYAED